MAGLFDLDSLDADDPFEVDDINRPHLYKHAFVTPTGRAVRIELSDVLDLYVWNAVVYFPAYAGEGDAEWLLVCEMENVVITVPLARPLSGDPRKCRPIGLYEAAAEEQDRYFEEGKNWEKK